MAIVGAGLMGTMHALNFATFGDRVRVRCVCDTRADRAQRLAERLGAVTAADAEAALLRSDIDAVAICIPPHLHRAVAERAFSCGKHVFLEKPIATTKEDADAIVSAAERSGLVLMVGLVLRFWPGYCEVHRQATAGDLGCPLAVSTYRLQPPAPWGDAWVSDPKLSGGIAPLVLVHDFDQINWLFGRPHEVSAHAVIGAGISAKHVVAIAKYEQGLGIAEGSVAMPPSYPFSSNIRVICDRGAAEFGFDSQAPVRLDDETTLGAETNPFAAVHEPVLRVYRHDSTTAEVASVDSHDLWRPELAHFLECVEGACAPEKGTGEQARDALMVALAANRSLESGFPEPV